MRCQKMEELPVVTEWQTKIYCPNCKYYYSGQCCNPERKNNTPCQLANVEPLELKNKFKFKVYQQVIVKTHDAIIYGKIADRQLSTIGPLYEIAAGENRFWITEDCLE